MYIHRYPIVASLSFLLSLSTGIEGANPAADSLLGRVSERFDYNADGLIDAADVVTWEIENHLPGALIRLYRPVAGGPEFLLEDVPLQADYGYVAPLAEATELPIDFPVMLRIEMRVRMGPGESPVFEAWGGIDRRSFGLEHEIRGGYNLDVRFAIEDASQLPAGISWRLNEGELARIDEDRITHYESGLPPILNSLPSFLEPSAGESVVIEGLALHSVEHIHWGDTILDREDLEIAHDQIVLSLPPGNGIVEVFARSQFGDSNSRSFDYGRPEIRPVAFDIGPTIYLPKPTRATWGPDARLYVSTLEGYIYAYEVDEAYRVLSENRFDSFAELSNSDILGIAFNPMDGDEPLRLYVAHGQLYSTGGNCSEDFSPYSGQVSTIGGPDFDTIQPLITGLPVSNHDHGINGLEFDNDGNLYICVGGNTNAGVPHCSLGGLPESPLSAAILKVDLADPNFNGDVRYTGLSPDSLNMDQQFGDQVDWQGNRGLSVYASGFRNTFDLLYTTSGRIYATDNGPNPGNGEASTGSDTSTYIGAFPDELNLLREGSYYGHPNRNRGRDDTRQNLFHSSTEGNIPGVHEAPIATFDYSTNGLEEYRAQTFGGAMKGDLLAQKFHRDLIRLSLSPDGTTVVSQEDFSPDFEGLDVICGPGGAIIGTHYGLGQVKTAIPRETESDTLAVYDILPWRGPTGKESRFLIGGVGFGSIDNTTVYIGDTAARLTRVSSKRIHGYIPDRNPAPEELLDVSVIVGGTTVHLEDAFQYIGNTVKDTGASARIDIDTGLSMDTSSTYVSGSFQITNSSTNGQYISQVSIDLRTALLPDLVFDPYGLAGDVTGKDLTIDNHVGGNVQHTFLAPHDGGFHVLRIQWDDFAPGETFAFSIDIDPTSIQGAVQTGNLQVGAVSAIELMGSQISTTFNDGTERLMWPYRTPGSDIRSRAASSTIPPSSPTIEVLGINNHPAIVPDRQQTIRIYGTIHEAVSLFIAECGLYLDGVPSGGFDIEPYEANMLLRQEEYRGFIGSDGYLDIPIELSKSDANSGLHYITSVYKDENGVNGPSADRIILQLE